MRFSELQFLFLFPDCLKMNPLRAVCSALSSMVRLPLLMSSKLCLSVIMVSNC
jgi:hypothetical protein